MKNFVEFITATGEIAITGVTDDPALVSDWHTGFTAIEAEGSSKLHYVDILDGNTLKDKVAMPSSVDKYTLAADGVDKVTITGIPVGTTYTIDYHTELIIDDGILEFTTDIPDRYVLVFRELKHLKEEVILVAA